MGSVPGAFVAALLIGLLQAFGVLVFPKITLVLVFLLMAAVLVVKPWGLFGKPEAAAGRAVLPEGILDPRPLDLAGKVLAGVALLALLALPLVDAYAVKNGRETLCATLLQTLMTMHGRPDQ